MEKVKNKTNLIFLHKIIKSIADSMVKVFVPLLILKQTQNMLMVMFYFCLFFPFCGIFNLLLKKFLQRYAVTAIILHIIPLVTLQFLFVTEINYFVCVVIALCMSLAQILYSVPINILFSVTDKSTPVAKFQICSCIGKIIFIIISGYIIGSEIVNSLLFISIAGTVLYICSIIPLFYGYKLLKESYQSSVCEKQQIDKKNYKLFNLYHFFFGITQSIIECVIPLFLYINKLDFQKVAIVIALIEVSRIVANIIANKLASKKLAYISTVISALVLIVCCDLFLFVRDPMVLFICSCLVGISFPLMFIPMYSIYIKKLFNDKNLFNGLSTRDFYVFAYREVLYIPYFIVPSFIVQFVLGIGVAIGIGITSQKIIDKEDLKIDRS